MYCKKTSIEEVARLAYATVSQAAESNPEAWNIYVYLQSYDAQAGGGHAHYGLHADASFGSKEAATAVNAALPSRLFCLENPEDFESAYLSFYA